MRAQTSQEYGKVFQFAYLKSDFLQLKTTTTVACSRDFEEDRIWLNGKEEDINQPRLQSCLRESG